LGNKSWNSRTVALKMIFSEAYVSLGDYQRFHEDISLVKKV